MQIEVKDLGLNSWLAIAALVGKIATWCFAIVGGAVWIVAKDYMNRVKLLEAQAQDLAKAKVDKAELEDRMAAASLTTESKFAGMAHMLEVIREEQRNQYTSLCRTVERSHEEAGRARESLSSRIDTLITSLRSNSQDRR